MDYNNTKENGQFNGSKLKWGFKTFMACNLKNTWLSTFFLQNSKLSFFVVSGRISCGD